MNYSTTSTDLPLDLNNGQRPRGIIEQGTVFVAVRAWDGSDDLLTADELESLAARMRMVQDNVDADIADA